MALISSTFDTDVDGWTVFGDAQGNSVVPTWNTSGYAFATDNVAGGVWFWLAPAKFLGDQSASFGVGLSFDLRQSATDAQFSNPDVTLEGAGLKLVLRFTSYPGTDWTAYSVTFAEGAGWTNATTGLAATAAELRAVLGDLDRLLIRGEYRTGADTGSIDDVALQSNLSRGGGGNDLISGDQFVAGSADTLYGLGGDDTLAGKAGNDKLYGGAGKDALSGGAGADRLQGDGGNDTLTGGLGKDVLIGGAGADVFDFNAAQDSAATAARDEIRDFTAVDRIDLSGIDANAAVAGNQAFSGITSGSGFGGSFEQPGALYYDEAAGVLYGNVDADAQADFSIKVVLSGITGLVAADFVL
jgi:Ca2+-binding RTX toxin-like protein